jgi:Clostripain family
LFLLYLPFTDNNLESFMRHDLFELTKSPAVQDPSITTWVYFDARNLGTAEDILEPIEGVYNADGTALTDKFEGSRYFTYDHSQAKMVIETILADEQNSDNPATLSAFVQHALTDCVAKGTPEYMMILSSHGGGYAGFGADDHERRRLFRGRTLSYQSNLSILTALQDSLAAVAGAPAQLDVLGFDACLMQSADALDEYREIAKYYMASEATEPAHGERNLGITSIVIALLDSFFSMLCFFVAARMGVQ